MVMLATLIISGKTSDGIPNIHDSNNNHAMFKKSINASWLPQTLTSVFKVNIMKNRISCSNLFHRSTLAFINFQETRRMHGSIPLLLMILSLSAYVHPSAKASPVRHLIPVVEDDFGRIWEPEWPDQYLVPKRAPELFIKHLRGTKRINEPE